MDTLPIMLAILSPFVLVGGLIFYHAYSDRQKHKKNRIAMETWQANLASIRPGMTKEKVFSLIGNNCTRSFLQDGTEVCEWLISQNGSAVMMHNNIGNIGFTTVQQSNGNEFSFKVIFKDDIVIEVITGNRMV